MVAGVCGGLGEYTGIDPIVFRIVLAVAAVAGGSGILAYVLAWIFIPDRPADGSEPPRRTISGTDTIVAIIVAVVALQIALHLLFRGDRLFDGDGSFLLLLLTGAGVWWWSRQDRADADSVASPPGYEPPSAPFPATDPPPPPPQRRRRSRLPLVGISVLLVLWGALLLADAAGATVDVQVAVGLSLAALGAVVLVGTWFGRPRGLIALGVVLATIGVVASAVDAPLGGGFGERSWIVRDAADLRDSYRLTAGEAVLDLRDLDLRRDEDVVVSVWAGELLVVLPPDLDVHVDARVGLGDLTVLGDHDDGFGLRARTGNDDSPTLRLEARMAMGELEVRRAAA